MPARHEFRLFPTNTAATPSSLLEFPTAPIAYMRRLHREQGDFAVVESDGQRLAFVFSPALNRRVLCDAQLFHSQFFAVRGGRRSAQRRVTSGLLSQNGAEHRETRRILKDVFAKRILPGYLSTISRLSRQLADHWTPGMQVDLNSSMVEFMLQMTSTLLFGEHDNVFVRQLGQLIDRWVRQNHLVGMGALVSSPEFADRYDELLRMAEQLEEAVSELIAHQRQRESSAANVLSLLLSVSHSSGSSMQLDLVGQTTLLFAAAHLTTAHTLSWTLLLLSQHPHVLERLRQEIDDRVAEDLPTFAELESLTYLDCVIRESMRILPASSYSQRITSAAAELAGVRLSAGTPVIFSQFITHHRPDLYEQPDDFIPERWHTLKPGPYDYLPFGAGPRMCIGAPLAMLELRTALCVLLRRFNFQLLPHTEVNAEVVSTMLGPVSPISARVLSPDRLPTAVELSGSILDLVNLPASAEARTRRDAA